MSRFFFTAFFTLLLSLFTSPTPAEENINMESLAKTHLDPLWENLDKGETKSTRPFDRWSYTLSPLFPNTWPPTSTSGLAVYAYASRHGDILDGFHVAAPWAKVIFSRDGAVKVEHLTSKLADIGIQGAKPLPPEFFPSALQKQTADDILKTLRTIPADQSPEALALRTYYRLWIKRNGVIAEPLRKHHPEFFAWLE